MTCCASRATFRVNAHTYRSRLEEEEEGEEEEEEEEGENEEEEEYTIGRVRRSEYPPSLVCHLLHLAPPRRALRSLQRGARARVVPHAS